MMFKRQHNQDNSAERGMVPFGDMINRLFYDPFFTDPLFNQCPSIHMSQMKVDWAETDTEFNVKAELPGVEPENIDIKFDHDWLTISAHSTSENEEKDKDFFRKECSYGQIRNAYGIKVDFNNGILQITLPKLEDSEGGSNKIPINA